MRENDIRHMVVDFLKPFQNEDSPNKSLNFQWFTVSLGLANLPAETSFQILNGFFGVIIANGKASIVEYTQSCLVSHT